MSLDWRTLNRKAQRTYAEYESIEDSAVIAAEMVLDVLRARRAGPGSHTEPQYVTLTPAEHFRALIRTEHEDLMAVEAHALYKFHLWPQLIRERFLSY